MNTKYYLNKDILPLPHDCIIKEIRLEDENLIFIFEDDITYHDSIINNNAKSLIIKYHLLDKDFKTYVYRSKFALFKEGYQLINNKNIIGIQSIPLEYLYHNQGSYSIIIKLYKKELIMIELEVDYIEYEWIM